MSSRAARVASSFFVISALAAGTAHASLIWESDPSRGTSQFGLTGQGNCLSPSFIDTTNDATFGQVIRYNKPSSENRCENHGIRLLDGTKYMFHNGQTVHLGWYYRINTTVNNNANFQWKSLGDGHVQNYPIVIKMIDNQLHLMQRQPQGNPTTFLFKRTISANQWNHVVLSLLLSNETRGGWIEFWFNGVQQTLLTGGTRFACRTWDTGDHNCPKWGVYGGTGTTMTNLVHRARVGTTYADVGIGGTPPPPTPTPTATNTPSPTPTPTPTTPTNTPTPTPTSCGCAMPQEVTPPGSAVTASTNDGNTPANTVDNNLGTRWSANGDGQWAQYDLGMVRRVTSVRVAAYQGNTRSNRFDIQVAGTDLVFQTVLAMAATSGTSTMEQDFDIPDSDARYVRYVGHGNVGSTNPTMNSVTEVSIFALVGGLTPTPTATPVVTNITPGAGSVTASTNDGNVPGNTVDGSLSTRWSANGDGQWIQYDLGSTRTVASVSAAWYQGDTRTSTFDVQVGDSPTGPFTTLATGLQGSGLALQSHNVPDGSGRYLRIVGHGNTTNAWNSITEVQIFGQ